MSNQAKLRLSLFALMQQVMGDRFQPIQCTKSTLVHLSHVLEDIVLQQRIPAILLTGFQESSHWRKETQRYRELAGIAKQVYIFAGRPLPQDSAASVVQVALDDEDPFRQEWFVLILSETFSVLLCGQDRQVMVEDEGSRLFDTFISFDHAVILDAIATMEAVLKQYRPDLEVVLTPYAQKIRPMSPSFLPTIINEMMHFEEQLIQQVLIANQVLKSEYDFNQQLIQLFPAFLLIVDEAGRIQSVNPAFLARFNLNETETLGKPLSDFVAPSDVPNFLEFMRGSLAGENPTSILLQTEMPLPSGEQIFVEWQATPILSAAHPSPLSLLTGFDMTMRRIAEQAREMEAYLRGMIEHERQLNRIKNQMMLTISHEFRTPLAIIQSSIDMLRQYYKRLSPEKRDERFDRIRQQIRHLSSMLDDLTLIIQMDDKVLQFQPQAMDADAFCRHLLSDIKNNLYPLVTARYLSTLPPDASLPLDKRLLHHILGNLLSNAFKYSPHGGEVWLRVALQGDDFYIEVEDNGIGIPKKDQERLFMAFERASNVGTIQGTGLGLRIVKDCVDLWGGRIRYQSAEGVGTKIQVWLPVRQSSIAQG